jgi:hypothetical protein
MSTSTKPDQSPRLLAKHCNQFERFGFIPPQLYRRRTVYYTPIDVTSQIIPATDKTCAMIIFTLAQCPALRADGTCNDAGPCQPINNIRLKPAL